MITILYFGVFKQVLKTSSEQIEWTEGNGKDLLNLLHSRGHEWSDMLTENKIFRLVINKQISNWGAPIPDGAEVGILPPVTGG